MKMVWSKIRANDTWCFRQVFPFVQAIGSWDFDDTMEQAQYQEKPQERV
jgi:hypothetical protein